ncbi:hypothetical protein [Kitasatospora sp. NPDC093806]|uniref:hypothetical protein n=1 Tax=Kitasatospora sp. NPDC093806 TaxID=3155075 RepID=UPI00342E0A1E
MSTRTPGAELLLELPGIPPGTVIGTAEITADGTEVRADAVVMSGVPVQVELPAEIGYSVRGRLTTGEQLTGYAETDGLGSWMPLPLAVLPGMQSAAEPAGPRFPGPPWAAGWTWEVEVGQFVRSLEVTAQQQAAGTLLTGSPGNATNLAQVSPSGGPASFVVLPDATPLWITGDRLEPEPGLAATLLDCLCRGDLQGAGAVAAVTLGNGKSIEPSSRPVLLDLALGYYLLDSGDSRLTTWAQQLAAAYDWSADAQVILASALLRSRGDHKEEIAERLEAAIACGLPAVTRGVQLLNDNLDLTSQTGSAARDTLLPYAIYARTDTVLTTFWGESPDTPQSLPVLVERPWHAVSLDKKDSVAWSGPITTRVDELLKLRPTSQPSAQPVLVGLLSSLAESLGLASRLSLAGTASEVDQLTPLLADALQQDEQPTSDPVSWLMAVEAMDPWAGHEQQAFKEVGTAMADARSELEAHRNSVGGATAYAARLAADVRHAVTALRSAERAAATADGAWWTAAAERTAVHAGEGWAVNFPPEATNPG